MRPNFNSIATRLILIGMAFIILGGIGRTFLLSNYLRDDIAELSSAQLLTLANYVAKDVDHNIVDRREALERLAAKFPLQLLRNPEILQSWLAERHEINPIFSHGLAVLDLSGVVLVDYPVISGRAGRSLADRDYFQQARQGEFAIGRPVIEQFYNEPVLPMGMPLRDGAGKVQGVLDTSWTKHLAFQKAPRCPLASKRTRPNHPRAEWIEAVNARQARSHCIGDTDSNESGCKHQSSHEISAQPSRILVAQNV